MARGLGYKRFTFTDAQQETLIALLRREHDRLMGGSVLERIEGRRYKGLVTSIRRQAVRQTEYLSKIAREESVHANS
jgi:hypothetical protein